jgi:hypothetical protein
MRSLSHVVRSCPQQQCPWQCQPGITLATIATIAPRAQHAPILDASMAAVHALRAKTRTYVMTCYISSHTVTPLPSNAAKHRKIGGGVAGLYTALKLFEAGKKDVVVFEVSVALLSTASRDPNHRTRQDAVTHNNAMLAWTWPCNVLRPLIIRVVRRPRTEPWFSGWTCADEEERQGRAPLQRLCVARGRGQPPHALACQGAPCHFEGSVCMASR